MDSSLILAVKEKFAAAPDTEKELWAQWNAIVDVIHAHALAKRPLPRTFEVHHMNEVARKALLEAFVRGDAMDTLKYTALAAIGLETK